MKLLSWSIGTLSIFLLCYPIMMEGAELRMVTYEHAPHQYLENGKVKGGCTQVVRQILLKMGYEPVIFILPWKRSQFMFSNGDADGIFVYTKTKERMEKAYYSNPIAYLGLVFYKRKSENISWSSLSDLKPYRVGASGGFNYPETFFQAEKKGLFKVEYVVSDNPNYQNLMKLQMNRIDLFICNPDVCGLIIKTHEPSLNNIDYISRFVVEPRPLYVGFSKKRPDGRAIRDKFNRYLDIFIANGKLKEIYEANSIKVDYARLGSGGKNTEHPDTSLSD